MDEIPEDNSKQDEEGGGLSSLLARIREEALRKGGEKVTFFTTTLPESGFEVSWEQSSRREIFVLRNAKGRGKCYYPLSEGTETFLTLERCLREALSENHQGESRQPGFLAMMWIRLWGRSVKGSWCLEDATVKTREPGLIGHYDHSRNHRAYLFRMGGWRKPHLRLLHINKSKTSGENVKENTKWRFQSVGLSLNDARALHEAILAFAG